MKFSLLSLLTFIFLITACTNDESPEMDEDMSITDQVDLLIAEDEYESALNILESEDQTNPEISRLLEKTHLNYGLYSMNTFDQSEMRSRMNNALVQFTEVLRINPENNIAREQIGQIMGVYATIPDRGPEPEVLEGLREVGFDY